MVWNWKWKDKKSGKTGDSQSASSGLATEDDLKKYVKTFHPGLEILSAEEVVEAHVSTEAADAPAVS